MTSSCGSFYRYTAFLITMTAPIWGQTIKNAFPSATFHPDYVGLLYPGFNVAAGVNAAALPSAGRGTALQAAFSPAPYGYDETRFFASLAHSKGNIGFGLGYLGALPSSSYGSGFQHHAFAGMGANFSNFHVGLGLRNYNLSNGFAPSVDAGMIVELKMLDVGLAFYGLDGTPRLGIGIGTRSGSRYNLEANVLLPPFSSITSYFVFTVSAQLTAGFFLAHFRTSYETSSQFLSHTLGIGAWITQSVNILAQYSTYNRAVVALTLSL